MLHRVLSLSAITTLCAASIALAGGPVPPTALDTFDKLQNKVLRFAPKAEDVGRTFRGFCLCKETIESEINRVGVMGQDVATSGGAKTPQIVCRIFFYEEATGDFDGTSETCNDFVPLTK